MNPVKTSGSMTKKELASKYSLSGKAFNSRLKKFGIEFGSDRVLLPNQIKMIIEAFGHWEEEY